jgi:hypothetical protein
MMKRSTAFLLLLGIGLVVGLVVYATTAVVGGNGSAEAWLAAHRQTPALWALDGVAGYTVLLTLSYGGQGLRLGVRNAQIERLQGEHRVQLEAMLTNTEKADELNVALADQIANQEEQVKTQEEQLKTQGEQLKAQDAQIKTQEEQIHMQEQTISSLAAQTAALQQEVAVRQNEIDARQKAFENEARRLAEQALHALSGQVDAQSRQLEAVNLALQYHRAELHQLRTGLRAIQAMPEPTRLARLTPAELAAIEAPHIEPQSPPETSHSALTRSTAVDSIGAVPATPMISPAPVPSLETEDVAADGKPYSDEAEEAATSEGVVAQASMSSDDFTHNTVVMPGVVDDAAAATEVAPHSIDVAIEATEVVSHAPDPTDVAIEAVDVEPDATEVVFEAVAVVPDTTDVVIEAPEAATVATEMASDSSDRGQWMCETGEPATRLHEEALPGAEAPDAPQSALETPFSDTEDWPAPRPHTINGADTVIMEPIHFKFVPAYEDPESDPAESAEPVEAEMKSETIAVVSAAEAFKSGATTEDESRELVAPLTASSEAGANRQNESTPQKTPAPAASRSWFARWQRKL